MLAAAEVIGKLTEVMVVAEAMVIAEAIMMLHVLKPWWLLPKS